MINILVIAILIIPWLIIPFNNIPDPTRLIKASFFDLAMLGIIVMAIKNGLKFEYKNKYLAYLSGWIFITFMFNWYYPIDRGLGYNAGTIDAMIHTILAIIATILVCSNFEKIDFIRCAKAICISSTLVSIFCIFQWIGLDPMKHIAHYGWKEPRHIAALLDNPDSVGNYICITLPLFIYFRKIKYIICLLFCIFALLLTKSSISILAAFLGLFVYCIFIFHKSRNIMIGIIASFFIFTSFCIMTPSFNKINGGFTGRVGAWKMMVERMNNPLFGEGLGSVKALNVKTGIKTVNDTLYDNFWLYAHNDYLETYCSIGAFGLFLLILLIVHTFRSFSYKDDNTLGYAYYGCFISFLIIMCGSFPMEMPPIALNGLIAFWAMQKT